MKVIRSSRKVSCLITARMRRLGSRRPCYAKRGFETMQRAEQSEEREQSMEIMPTARLEFAGK
jgi:hypothetical protein